MGKEKYEVLFKEVMAARLLLTDVSEQLHKEECDWMRNIGMLIMYLGGFPLRYCEKGLEAAMDEKCPLEASEGLLTAANVNVTQAMSVLKRIREEN